MNCGTPLSLNQITGNKREVLYCVREKDHSEGHRSAAITINLRKGIVIWSENWEKDAMFLPYDTLYN